MSKREKIAKFFSSKCIAISGVSRDRNKFGHVVFQTFRDHGVNALPVNPNVDTIDGAKVFASIHDLPNEVDGLVILNNKNRSSEIVNQAISKGAKNIWIQQKSEPANFTKLSFDPDINIITGECILMWLEPVKGFHKFHRFLKHLFSKNGYYGAS